MKLFLDAGHNDSGHDTGAIGNGLREQDITYSLAKLVGARLLAAGVEIAYSRPLKTDILGTNLNSSLNQRARMANDWGADYFVSLHCNAGGGTGAETYCLATGGRGEQLAKKIQAALTSKLGLADRGVKTANFAVLRKTNMPAVLVECGFIDNVSDAAILQSRLPELAAAIAGGILQFVGMSPAPTADYITAGEAIALLTDRGIITEPQKWYSGTWSGEDVTWLIRKVGTYLKG